MTIPEFLDRLRAIEARWALWDGTDIRCEAGDCPITRVANADVNNEDWFNPDSWPAAADAIGIDYEDAQAIVNAADLCDDFDNGLRVALLAATVGEHPSVDAVDPPVADPGTPTPRV